MPKLNYDPESIFVHVNDHSSGRMLIGSIHWADHEARFHVNVANLDDFTLSNPIVYKNPPVGVNRYTSPGSYQANPAYFETRKLDATAKANAGPLAEIIAIVRERGLVQVGRDKLAEEKRIEEDRNAQRRRLAHVRQLGPQFLDAVRELFRAETTAGSSEELRLARSKARDLIALAEAPFEDLKGYTVAPIGQPERKCDWPIYAANERAAREEYCRGHGRDVLPDEVEVIAVKDRD